MQTQNNAVYGQLSLGHMAPPAELENQTSGRCLQSIYIYTVVRIDTYKFEA